ncbi:hypothetical protein DH2020_039481 [Rehmannia glutinosa]|uniref:Endonuclease/exonuclease/phosphatase domain-containing protein n=1 Tax=Rehmannia glutinosa TaxID=99300 RepID=A0ABR0UVQ2_REHGL
MEQPSTTTITDDSLWIQAYDLPVACMNEKALTLMAKQIGQFEKWESNDTGSLWLPRSSPAENNELLQLELSGAWEPPNSSSASTRNQAKRSHSGFPNGNQVRQSQNRCDLQKNNFTNNFIVRCDRSLGGRRGKLCLMWKFNIDIHIHMATLHVIDARICENDPAHDWRLTCIYGWSEENLKNHTWQMIKNLYSDSETPWLAIGDFNEILFHHEKIGGRQKEDSKLQAFREAIAICGLDDLGFQGYKFTWTNGQGNEANIQERLDRCLANIQWASRFPDYVIEHQVRICSDHCPILTSWKKRVPRNSNRKSHVIRFEKMWLEDESCKPAIHNAWAQMESFTSPSIIRNKIHSTGISHLAW